MAPAVAAGLSCAGVAGVTSVRARALPVAAERVAGAARGGPGTPQGECDVGARQGPPGAVPGSAAT